MGVSVNDIDSAPSKLPLAAGIDFEQKYRELNDRFSLVSDELFKIKEEHSALRAKNRTHEILDELIRPYAKRTFWFMCLYCAFVGLIIAAAGYKSSSYNSNELGGYGFRLGDDVLKILVGSTAVTVIGLVGMVLTGIFVGARRK